MQHLDEGTLQAWLDRSRSGMSGREIDDVERHVATCPQCARRANELDSVSDRAQSLLGGTRPITPPLPGYGAIVAVAHGVKARRRVRSAAWAASVIVALGIGWLSGHAEREPPAGAQSPDESVALAPDTAAPSVALPIGPTPDAPAPREVSMEPPVLVAAAPDPALAVPSPAPSGASPWTIEGRVMDLSSGLPIPAAQVFISDLDIGVLTRQDGSYRLSLQGAAGDADLRDVTITVQRIGYRQETRDVVAMSGQPVTADFDLAEQALALDEIIVTGRPSPQPRRAIGNTVTAGVPSQTSTSWRPVGRAAAEAEARFTMLTVPDLPLVSIEVSPEGAIRVVQRLDGPTLLTLIERRGQSLAQDRASPNGESIETTRLDSVSVTAIAPLASDSLRALIARLR